MLFDDQPYLNEDETHFIEKWIEQEARYKHGVKAVIPAGVKIRTAQGITNGFAADWTRKAIILPNG